MKTKIRKIDMSEEAVLRRLKQVDELRELCLSLMKAKKESDEKKSESEKKEKAEAEDFDDSPAD